MRQNNKAVAATGTLRTKSIGARQLVILIVASVAIAWAAIAFAQEAYISHKLSQQASDLRQQNAQLGAQNAAYKKDVQTITSGAAAEEDARLNGYAKPNERTFLVAPAASPLPSPSPSPKQSPAPSPGAH